MATQTEDGQGGRIVISAYVPAALADALRAKAKVEERTLSQVISRTLRTALRSEER